MSTFFEKLTGSRQKAVAAESADIDLDPQEPRSRQARTAAVSSEESKTTRLKVATEDPLNSDTTPEEEEGELTVDIYDRGDTITIQSTVAGVRPEDLDVSVTNDTVTIRGRRDRGEEIDEKNYYYKELFWGNFSRSVILPEEIEEDMAEANLRHGLLTLHLPKRKRGVVQKLKVKLN